KAANSRAEIIRSEIGSIKKTCDKNIKNNKYCEFYNEKSCHDEYLAHDCELVIEIEGIKEI
ncbi:30179_t:CDS:1, partial [Racocetra persica]